MLKNQPLKVFISYSHKDEELKEELEVHLATLVRQGKIASWHDRALEAGTEWESQIKAALQAADILLLLVSPRFMASDYINNIELKVALERHRAGTVRVIPIVLKPVDWDGTDIAALVALPKDGQPITTWKNQDEAFRDVAKGLRKVVESLQASKNGVASSSNSSPPISGSDFYQRFRSSNTQPNGDKALSDHNHHPSRKKQGQRPVSRHTSRLRLTQPQRTEPHILEVVKGSWYYILPILILWVIIGFYQQEVGDLSGQREMLGFSCLGALGGFLTGIITSLAWQKYNQSRFQIDAIFLWSLVGLVTGGLLWVVVYFLFGPSFILAQGMRIGLGIGFASAFMLLWQIRVNLAKNVYR